MKKLVSIIVCLFLWAAVAVEASEKKLQRQILGVRLNMTKDEAHKRLQEIGTFVLVTTTQITASSPSWSKRPSWAWLRAA